MSFFICKYEGQFCDDCYSYDENNPCKNLIEVATVRHGKWIFEPVEFTYEKDIKCSICGTYVEHISNYCPDCGAKMDAKEN
jgi:hypothetical protein